MKTSFHQPPITSEAASPLEEILEVTEVRLDRPWRVILYNDDVHTFDEVIYQLQLATGCSMEQAEKFAWETHTKGKANVYEGEFEDCFRAQMILKEIELITEIQG